jgi:ubiquinone/menaquinone biosynthesis C-methylase UbiE
MGTARYDEIAEWYDTTLATDPAYYAMPRAVMLELLGPPTGALLDVGCGGGTHTSAYAEAGWDVTGVDPSEAQLRLARERGCDVVQAWAEDMPFPDDSFDAVASTWTHTDIDDWAAVLREVKRVARPGAQFVYLGVHPCFVGPHSAFAKGEGVPLLHAGYYRTPGRYHEAPGISAEGIRGRVGAVHLPLAEFLHAFIDAGLAPERIIEPGTREFPIAIALRCRA